MTDYSGLFKFLAATNGQKIYRFFSFSKPHWADLNKQPLGLILLRHRQIANRKKLKNAS